MNQTVSQLPIQPFLAQITPFESLGTNTLQAVAAKCQVMRYRIGQQILVREKMPAFVSIISQGQVRLLGYDQRTQMTVSLQLVGPGEILGACSLVRGVPTEIAIASTKVICMTLAAKDFLALVAAEDSFSRAFQDSCALSEVFELLSVELQRRADGTANIKELAFQVWKDAVVLNLTKARNVDVAQLDLNRVWLVSGGGVTDFPVGSRLPLNESYQALRVEGRRGVRLVGLNLNSEVRKHKHEFIHSSDFPTITFGESNNAKILHPSTEIPYAPDHPPDPPLDPYTPKPKYPYVRGRGPIDAPLACFQMLSQHLGVSFRRDLIRKVLENQLKTADSISLQVCGAISEMMGLRAQLVQVPATAVNRLKAPVFLRYCDTFAIIYSITERELVMAVPEVGILRKKPGEFAEIWGTKGQVLLLQSSINKLEEKFSLRWFLPSIYRYRKVLAEVLIASLFVQLFGLANPIITQVIIDKVLVQHSIDTLDVLGIFLLGVAFFEALLTSLRTYLFVDTTNRIDLSLGSEVIDHLLRLPLKYFERRRIGELADRINELENIRKFLTGTVLTVVLDAVFSVVYVAVMLVYSWLLTLVALVTVPLFALLTIFVSPIVRRQLHKKAERHADTQSYLVEVLSGIQTVKAQNIEMKSRWQWQERYAKYISAGFKNVLTFSTASSISGFLNKVSGLLLLWVGAHLVLSNQLTLGQLIAFRIIAGYVTSPLLRLIQLWQNFQETALSIERLGDILDAPPEVDETNRNNIPLPEIKGAVKYEGVSFSFQTSGPLQLFNINLEIPTGAFIGIVGQSGSGKSTLTKLLQRLYEPTAGRILIDGYDISKVELYSLRRQIGTVLQDTLLFNGTVQDNIALTNPEASSEQIIEAAKIAVAHDFIMSLPNGYNTVVGERGASLSGGQRQRIAIARTVLQNPKLLILDEATSALDYNSERQVCDNLAEAFRGRTVFFITHRLTTVKNADVILVMEQGSVVEQGTHKELMTLKGRYYCLYQQQESQL
ncbi:peptidase domain-containing ABC transporter [Brasilonema sp. UFV-L1]|uniref:peptidase domain-containing ABC transporter n=1 Tax=Brasilonema sp. UFV-L1 TaxID=2234130 RepID=UPI00145DEE9A|nr:peptidase domain-containing ABC transporter [Brasilonema sp. UFV-L1]NMG07565.1 type I secretion system permease/ATPase [Brasilonema sp. UFV-L1]